MDRFITDLLRDVKPRLLRTAALHLIRAGGKRLRPYLCVKAFEATTRRFINIEPVIPVAAAIELLHNFTLVHDDIMDQSDMRRGVPTVHIKFGTPLAIDAGDLLFAKVYEAVLSGVGRYYSVHVAHRILQEITHVSVTLCQGQAEDILREKTLVSPSEYFHIVEWKTSSLMIAAVRCGAYIARASKADIDALSTYAKFLGVGFQIVDDILGVIGVQEVTGKPVGDDLRAGKPTLILYHALSHAKGSARRILEKVVGNPSASDRDVKCAIETIMQLGSIDYARKQARDALDRAKQALSELRESDARQRLSDLADFVLERTY